MSNSVFRGHIDDSIHIPHSRIARTLALLVIGMGTTTLAGWVFSIEPLKNIFPGFVTMKVSTAVTLILSGCALYGVPARSSPMERAFSKTCATMAILISLITLCEYLGQMDLGIDHFFLKPFSDAPWTQSPGRMAATAALNLFLLNSLFLAIDHLPSVFDNAVDTTLFLAGLLVLSPLLTYGYGAHHTAPILGNTAMALHTAIAFLLLALGTLVARPDRSFARMFLNRGAAGSMLRILMPALFLITPILGYVMIQGERAGHFDTRFAMVLLILTFIAISTLFLFLTSRRLESLEVRGAESRKILKQVMDAVEDGLWDWNLQTSECSFSARWYTMLGYTPDELPASYETWKRLVHPDDIGRAEEALRHHNESRKGYSIELRMKEKSGGWRWIETRGSLVSVDEAGRPLRMIGTHTDISSRKAAEDALRENKAFLHSIIENIPHMLFVKDAKELRMILCNRAVAEITGYPTQALIGKSDFDLFPQAQAEFFTSKDHEVLQSGKISDIPEESLQSLEKGVRTLHTKKIPLMNEKGEPTYLLGISEDITERKAIEETMRALSRGIEQTTDGIVLTDINGIITYVNPAFEKMTGYRSAEVLGSTPRILKSGQVPPQTYQNLWETILSGKTFHGVFTNRRKDGGTYITELTISPIRDTEGRIIHFVAAQKDITHQKQMERTIAQTEKMAAVGQLAAGVAHELNNPLSGILGFTQLLLDDLTLTHQQREDLTTILTQSQRCRDIIQNLLQFSRPRATKNESVDVAHLIQATLRLINYEFTKSGISVRVEAPAMIPPVMCDAGALQQVFINLLTNARHALEEREKPQITIRLAVVNHMVQIEVSDNGPGIPAHIVGKIFDPFFTTKAPGKGTGLGLSICHSIMQQCRGQIQLESREGEGATFTLSLPVSDDTLPPPAATPTLPKSPFKEPIR